MTLWITLWHKCNWEKWLEDANRQQESWILSSISKGNYYYYYYSYYYWTAFLQDCILINICNVPWFEKSMSKFVSSGNGLTATINPWNTRDVSCGHHQSLGFRKKQLYPLISWSLLVCLTTWPEMKDVMAAKHGHNWNLNIVEP